MILTFFWDQFSGVRSGIVVRVSGTPPHGVLHLEVFGVTASFSIPTRAYGSWLLLSRKSRVPDRWFLV
jgi:hypothetical protein